MNIIPCLGTLQYVSVVSISYKFYNPFWKGITTFISLTGPIVISNKLANIEQLKPADDKMVSISRSFSLTYSLVGINELEI